MDNCKIEALAITEAVKHFIQFIIQSAHKTCVLTDSCPWVLAFQNFFRGDFSTILTVTTFLSAIWCYHVHVVVKYSASAKILQTILKAATLLTVVNHLDKYAPLSWKQKILLCMSQSPISWMAKQDTPLSVILLGLLSSHSAETSDEPSIIILLGPGWPPTPQYFLPQCVSPSLSEAIKYM